MEGGLWSIESWGYHVWRVKCKISRHQEGNKAITSFHHNLLWRYIHHNGTTLTLHETALKYTRLQCTTFKETIHTEREEQDNMSPFKIRISSLLF